MTDALRHIKFAGRPTSPSLAVRPPLKRQAPAPAGSAPMRPSPPPGRFISWVFERAGLKASHYRGEPLERRLPACLRTLHAHTEHEARHRLEERPDLLPAALSSLLIGVTHFFRDEAVFETLRTEVLPELSRRGRPLRVWSAGCSTGVELYSMAILLAGAGLLEGSTLLGTDCRGDAIEQARAATYTAEALKPIGPEDRGTCFEAAGDRWRPVAMLRRRVRWKVADLSRHTEAGPWDLILWRNMAIYLQAEARACVWQRLASVLEPEGVLVVGKAESPPNEAAMVCVGRCVYRAGRRAGHSTPGTRATGGRP